MRPSISSGGRATASVDAEAVLAVAAGDLSGLGMLFDRFEPDVRRLLARLGVSAHELDDLVQETFLDVVRASPRFRPGSPVRPWLLGIASMVVRRRRRSFSRMLDRLRAWALEPHIVEEPSVESTFERNVEALRARRALESLSTKKRDAFVLVVLEEMSGAEAAEVLGIPLATLWTRIHHARLELRAHLEQGEG